MTPSRRDFLIGCGAGAAAWATIGLIPGQFLVSRVEAAELSPDQLRELSAFALDRAKKAGATYADIRINRYRGQIVSMRSQADPTTGKLNHIPSVGDSETFGFGIRVLAGGAWGFSASNTVTREEIGRAAVDAVATAKASAILRREPIRLAPVAAYQDTYATPIARDPFADLHRGEARPPAARRGRGQEDPRGLHRDRIHRPADGTSLVRFQRGEQDRAARLPDRAGVHGDGGGEGAQAEVAHLPAALGHRRLRGGGPRRHRRQRAAGRRRSRQPPQGAVRRGREEGPGAAPDAPRPDDPRVHRALHGARPGARLRSELRRHVVPHAGEARASSASGRTS